MLGWACCHPIDIICRLTIVTSLATTFVAQFYSVKHCHCVFIKTPILLSKTCSKYLAWTAWACAEQHTQLWYRGDNRVSWIGCHCASGRSTASMNTVQYLVCTKIHCGLPLCGILTMWNSAQLVLILVQLSWCLRMVYVNKCMHCVWLLFVTTTCALSLWNYEWKVLKADGCVLSIHICFRLERISFMTLLQFWA